jgi:hypothetical protein
MADIMLSQAEADMLIDLDKVKASDAVHTFPGPGGGIEVPLVSRDRTEHFVLDVTRGRIDLAKVSYNTRGRHVICLVRLDVNGPPHRNPDGEEVACPHLHRYREGYGLRWAEPLATGAFSDLGNMEQTLSEFLSLCHVSDQPLVQSVLF